MNDIAKAATVDKFSRAIQAEGLGKAEAGAFIGLMPAQVSYLFNEKYWDRLGNNGFDAVLKWVNSGQSLKEYSEKHGKVLPEIAPQKHIELPPKVVKVTEPKENTMKPEDVGVKKIVVERSDKGIKIEGAELKGNIWEKNDPEREFKFNRTEQHQKFSLDIEINLVINGKKISL